MNKQLVRRALKNAVAGLPASVRQGVYDLVRRVSKAGAAAAASLPESARQAVFEQICEDCHVVSLKVSGRYGAIQSLTDIVLTHYAINGTYSEHINNQLKSFFAEKGGNYIDIGANIGLTTIPVAQNARVRCLAIEPEPRNFINLCANIAENCPHKNVEVRRLAIFVRPQTLRFELSSGENLGDHRLHIHDKARGSEEHERATIEVEAVCLDEIAGNLKGSLAVKIDTQGAEPFVVLGGKETLSRAELIISEFWPYGMAQLGGNPGDLIEFLHDQFSTLVIMGEDGSVSPRPASEVCAQLTALVKAHSENPEMSVDVLARR
jgi:FkbM family methyltransferase